MKLDIIEMLSFVLELKGGYGFGWQATKALRERCLLHYSELKEEHFQTKSLHSMFARARMANVLIIFSLQFHAALVCHYWKLIISFGSFFNGDCSTGIIVCVNLRYFRIPFILVSTNDIYLVKDTYKAIQPSNCLLNSCSLRPIVLM